MNDACSTCYGTGEVVTEQGAQSCPDCFGDGQSQKPGKIEWRLRELEKVISGEGETAGDVRWLIHELRKCRGALIHILTSCQDADDDDQLAARIKHQVNQALGIYAEATKRA
jgi:hypothetical protein